MPAPRIRFETRPGRVTVVFALALLFAMPALWPEPAEAQSAVKRSGTSGSRGGASVRRGASPARRSAASMRRSVGPAKQAGSDSAGAFRGQKEMTETVRGNGAEGLAGESAWDEGEEDWEASGLRRGDADALGAEGEVVDFGARTLGKACIYGRRGEVLFRPAGSICRGDTQAIRAGEGVSPEQVASPQSARRRQNRSPQAPLLGRSQQPQPSPQQKQQRTGKIERSDDPSPSARRGSCIRGGDGRVLYAPPGVKCRN